MPPKTSVTAWYLVLALAVFASAGFMGLQIRERIRPDLGAGAPPRVAQPDQSGNSAQPAPTARDIQADQRRIGVIFNQTRVFQPIATPKPTPTRPPEPVPTPTALPLAQNYRIRNILGSSAILLDYRLQQIVVRKGSKVDDQLGPFTVEEVDPINRRVRVKLISTGDERWIDLWEGQQQTQQK